VLFLYKNSTSRLGKRLLGSFPWRCINSTSPHLQLYYTKGSIKHSKIHYSTKHICILYIGNDEEQNYFDWPDGIGGFCCQGGELDALLVIALDRSSHAIAKAFSRPDTFASACSARLVVAERASSRASIRRRASVRRGPSKYDDRTRLSVHGLTL
jgi:hypothetical protein